MNFRMTLLAGLLALSVFAFQTQAAPLQPGTVAPNFSSKDLAGKTVQLSDFKGKVVVLDFWATWCGPCIASMPHTEEVAKSHKGQGVVVLAVCTSDSRAEFEKWIKTNSKVYGDITFTCDPNEKGSTSFDERASKKHYGVTGIPTQFVIGKDGKIVATLVGYSKGDTRLESALAQAGIK